MSDLMSRYHGLLLAAGKARELSRSGGVVAKALLKVGDETLIDHNLARLADLGLRHIVVVVGNQADDVIAHLAASPRRDRIEFVRQEQCLGAAHAVAVSRHALRSEPFVLCYADNYTPYRLAPLVRAHEEQRNAVTLALFRAQKPKRHDIIQLDGGRVKGLVERPKAPAGNLAFAGMGVFQPCIHDAVKALRPSDSGEYRLTGAVMDLVRAREPVGFDVLACPCVNVDSLADLELAWTDYLTRRDA